MSSDDTTQYHPNLLNYNLIHPKSPLSKVPSTNPPMLFSLHDLIHKWYASLIVWDEVNQEKRSLFLPFFIRFLSIEVSRSIIWLLLFSCIIFSIFLWGIANRANHHVQCIIRVFRCRWNSWKDFFGIAAFLIIHLIIINDDPIYAIICCFRNYIMLFRAFRIITFIRSLQHSSKLYLS